MPPPKDIWTKAEKGIRYREHPERMHNRRRDRYYVIRYSVNGEKKQEALGWASDGVTLEKARLVRAKLHEAKTLGKGPTSIAEQRDIAEQTKREAEEAKLIAAKNAISFEDYWENSYWPAQEHKARGSRTAEKALWTKWISPILNSVLLFELCPTHLDQIKMSMLTEKKSPASVKYALAVISQVWTRAKQDGLVSGDSPTKYISIPKIDNRRQRYLSKEESALLLSRLKQEAPVCHDMTLLALGCGLRFGEVASLTWQDCEFSKGGQIFIRDPKARENRFAFMTPRVLTMLTSLHANKGSFGLIFVTSTGTKFDRIPKIFRAIANDLFNQNVEDPRQKVCYHTLRHTFASRLVESDISLYAVKELMGHSDFKMTQRYAHLSPENLKRAIAALSEV